MSSGLTPRVHEDLAAERAVLGAIVMDNSVLAEVAEQIIAEDFANAAHGTIFAAMMSLDGRQMRVDPLTLAEELKVKGLDRVNISLDSLDSERYRRLTRGGSLEAALEGVEAALRFDLSPVKLNAVIMEELVPELPAFVRLTRDRPLHVRFIEWMPVGGCGPRASGDSLGKADVLGALEALGTEGLGDLRPVASPGGWGPAEYFRFAGHQGTVGFIGSVSDHFCAGCNRLRLTADGHLKNCLFTSHEVEVKGAVQDRDEEAVARVIAESLETKTFDKDLLPGRSSRGMSQVGG